jgi:heme-degrading monooxygenase HmoA
MYSVVHQLTPRPDSRAEFEAVLREMASMFEGVEGFVSHQLLRPRKEGDPYFAFTAWKDQEAWKAWTKTAEAKLHKNPKFKDFDKMYATAPFEGFYDDVVTLHG